jgi:hypothetical protein
LLTIGSRGILLSPDGKGSDDFLTDPVLEFVRDGRGGGTKDDCKSNEVLLRRLISLWAISIAVGEGYEIPVKGGVERGECTAGSLSLLRSNGGGTEDLGEARLAGLGGYENGPLGVPESEYSGE